MTGVIQPTYTNAQIATWLRGLITLAWADGHFDAEEQELIHDLLQADLGPAIDLDHFTPLSLHELAEGLGPDPSTRENFLRTAVMVAIADGVYSAPEDDLLHSFATALDLDLGVLAALRTTLHTPDNPEVEAAITATQGGISTGVASPLHGSGDRASLHPLRPIQDWLDGLEVHDPRLARFLCKMIPPQCPFERDIQLFGHKVVHIPPLCKLNPLYEQMVGLRFRALCYLADNCGEDVTRYC
ncbi:Mo-dependent nitrogenase C-terminal domain-containing protein [Trichothermofontia sp.]